MEVTASPSYKDIPCFVACVPISHHGLKPLAEPSAGLGITDFCQPAPAWSSRRHAAAAGDIRAALAAAGQAGHDASPKRLNPALNAVVTPMFDDAIARVSRGVSGPFAGVLYLLKDLVAESSGSRSPKDQCSCATTSPRLIPSLSCGCAGLAWWLSARRTLRSSGWRRRASQSCSVRPAIPGM
jgi:hypothetical protein